jgi:hypothetical protein
MRSRVHRPTRAFTRAAILASSLVILAGCGGSSASSAGHTYPANVKTNFLNACEARASTASCTCEFAYIQKHVSLATFTAADKALRAGTGGIPAWLLNAARACVHAAGSTTT